MNRIQQYIRGICMMMLLTCASSVGAQMQLQYWFDTNRTIKSANIPTSGTLNGTIDVQFLSQGFHTIYMRVKSSSTEYPYSPITSAKFFKFAASGETGLQYWFDDDVTNIGTVPINVDSGAEQVINLDVASDINLPIGLHKISMRVADGGHYSPIYTAYFMRTVDGTKNYITYWLDDDYEHRHKVPAVLATEKGARFYSHIDLSNVSMGAHRLRYRVSTNDVDDGPIYEDAILVTKKYNSNMDVKIVNQSYWLDDANTSIYAIQIPKGEVSQSYILSPSEYTDGQHAFHVQYQNNADVWSEQNITYFYKEPATGKLRVGIMPDEYTDIDDVAETEQTTCTYRNGVIIIDCQSPKLSESGTVYLCDISGRIITQQTVNNSDGIHAELNVEGFSNQFLIVKLVCGGIDFKQKIMVK